MTKTPLNPEEHKIFMRFLKGWRVSHKVIHSQLPVHVFLYQLGNTVPAYLGKSVIEFI